MRIAYICADAGVPVFGRKGCSIHVQEVNREFRNRGAQVDLFAARLGGEPPADLRDLGVHLLPSAPRGDVKARERAALGANSSLRVALRQCGPFDFVYERYSLWSFAGMAFAQEAGIPGLLEVNAPLIDEQAAHRGLNDRPGAERVAERAFGAASAVIAVSQEVADYVRESAISPGQVHVIPNGVNLHRFRDDIPPVRDADRTILTVGFVGTLKPWHGLTVLFEAFEALHRADPNTRLLLVGDGPERTSLEAHVAARGLNDSIEFTGAVDPGEIPGLLASIDIAVAPYPPQDGFYFSPLKVFEYMAASRAVVASRIGQLIDLIEDGENGMLYPPGDVDALVAVLSRLATQPDLRSRLGRAAHGTIKARHTWAKVIERIFQVAGVADSCQTRLAKVGA